MNTKKFVLKTTEEAICVLGPQDLKLKRLENKLKISIFVKHSRKDETVTLTLKGSTSSTDKALRYIRQAISDYRAVSSLAFPSKTNLTKKEIKLPENAVYKTEYGELIFPRGKTQSSYVKDILSSDMVISVGPAGTGKTFLAAACALKHLAENKIKKIIITRPIVEAGENLGFLPGDIEDKVYPYLRPLYDAFYTLLGAEKFRELRDENIIETVPLAYMRGRTLENAFIILDEAQNTLPEQIKMFLTRMGVFSKIVITGDITQIDLKEKNKSGLVIISRILKNIKSIKFTKFTDKDIVRHALVKSIIQAYDKYENGKKVSA
ncbi:MAG: PhoH family protein [Elusimicrobiota bacterium]|nr:PhoH family protein [Elusimicrobiota bacterium]